MMEEKKSVEALVVRIEGRELAVLNSKNLSADRRSRDALLNGVRRSGQFSEFVVVEKFDSVSQELIAIDIERGTALQTDLHFDLAAAALAKIVFRGAAASGISSYFLHRPSGVQAQVVHHPSKRGPDALAPRLLGENFEVTLLRQGQANVANVALSHLDIRHAYLDSPSVKISLPEHGSITVSLLAASKCVYTEPGKAVVVALRADSLLGYKKKASLDISSMTQQTLIALVKHIAACLHIAQAAIKILLIWPSSDADFMAAQWLNEGPSAFLQRTLSASAFVALAELANSPGTVVQGIARVLPGVPTRIAHQSGTVEVMASSYGVTRAVRALPVSLGELFSHSI
jgi:hypothetical protein